MNIRVKSIVALMIAGMFALTGCGVNQGNNQSAASQTTASSDPLQTPEVTPAPEVKSEFLTFTDSEERTVTLKSQPQRIVVMSPEILNMLYAIGGTVVGRADATDIDIPAGAEQAESVGQVSEVSTEKLVALAPDLVIGQPRFHRDLAQTLESSGIPLALMQVSSYDQISTTLKLLGTIAGKEEAAKQAAAALDQRVGEIKDKIPEKQLTFANLNVTPGSVSIQRTGTIGLDIAKSLNMVNIAEQMEADAKSPTTVPYSLEKLVEQDPDYIFLIIHGSRAAGQKKIKTDMESNPAWSSLTAVKEKHVIIVPSSLFLTNPGLNYDKSLTYLAQYVYPDIFGTPVQEEASETSGKSAHGK
ncbi:ABC transporter substrate-binding protein [Paenibacillus sp. PK3_47]|uniref:ABC transporter substrate-binding protein n=1 Tax=Paenibacillus sp. PK3_47 TaxID=2072642 RepID=UPI00201DC2AE|nr:ABC transporter substrate-binding protein [Paenibacillus sp. PK3_47]